MKIIIEVSGVPRSQIKTAMEIYDKQNPIWLNNDSWNFETQIRFNIATALERVLIKVKPQHIKVKTEKD